MSVLCLNVCRLCVQNIMSLSMFKKIAPHQNWLVCLMQHQNSRYFRGPIWKTKSW